MTELTHKELDSLKALATANMTTIQPEFIWEQVLRMVSRIEDLENALKCRRCAGWKFFKDDYGDLCCAVCYTDNARITCPRCGEEDL